MPFLSQSYHIESNKANDVCRDTGDVPLEGIRVTEDEIIRRFHRGLLDGDTPEGKRITQPAVEGPGHIEYWREGCLHRDGGLPAVSANGFTHKEWWEHGEQSGVKILSLSDKKLRGICKKELVPFILTYPFKGLYSKCTVLLI